MTLTGHRTFQYVGILLALAMIAAGYWYFAVRAGVKTNTSGSQPQGIGDLSAGLAGYWKLDENTGTSASDSSTNGNAGTLTNGPTWTTGQIGSAVNFDGIDDYINLGTINNMTNPSQVSGAAWVKIDDIAFAKTHVIFSNATSGNNGMTFSIPSGASCSPRPDCTGLRFTIQSVADYTTGGGAIYEGEWTHLAFVWNGSAVSFYVNGSLFQTISTGSMTTGTSMLIGASGPVSGPSGYLDGSVDEARLYDRTLSADEVASLYRLTTPTGVDTSLKGYWSFNSNALSGTTAFDWSGAGNTGTLTNGPTITEGRVGQALSFDGTNDYVNAGSAAMLDDMSTFSVAGWFNSTVSSCDKCSLVSKGYGTGGSSISGWKILEDVTGSGRRTIGFQVDFSGTDLVVESSVIYSLSEWHHFTVTWDGSTSASNVHIYLDGIEMGYQTQTNATGTYTSDASQNLNIGVGDSMGALSVKLDEIRIYNRTLTAAEIKSQYNRGTPDKANTSAAQPTGTGNLSSGLAAYWKLDENTGTSAGDASVNGNTGTLTNSPTWVTGQIGSAIDFDGTDDYIAVADADSLDFGDTDDFTLTGWFNREAYTTDDALVAKRTTLLAASAGYIAYLDDATDQIIFEVSDGTDEYSLTSTTTFTTAGWHHFVIVWDQDSASNTEMYIDGVANNATDSGTIANVGDMSNAVQFGIGVNSLGGDDYDGKIDEVRVYDRALSTGEITDLYRLASPTGVDTSLRGYWSFNGQDLSGTTAYDRSGVGNNGTLSGGSPVVEGRVGQALSFDNVDDYVIAGSPSAVDNLETQGGGGMTASAWIYPESGGTFGGVIVGKRAVPGPGDGDWAFTIHQDGNAIKFYKSHSTTNLEAMTRAGSIVLNKWQFVTATWNGSATRSSVTFYIDGVLVPTSTTGGTDGVGTKDSDAAESVSISSQFIQFDGLIDEVRLHNRILSATEIKALYDTSAPDKTNTSVSTPQGTGRPDSGLAAYWKLDENTGTSAGDASVNGNTGTLTNGPTWVTGQVNSGVDLDGTDDYIAVADADSLDFGDTDDFTLTGWFNREAYTTDDALVAKRTTLLAASAGYIAYLDDATDQIIFEVSDGTDEYSLTSTTTFTTAGWHHFVIVWDQDSASNTEMYIDGVANNATDSGTIANVGDMSNAVQFGIGVNSLGGDDYDGKIDEVRVYDRALSTGEITDLYRLTAPTGTDTGLKGYWSFNGQDLSGTTAYDRSGSGNNGTLTNGPTVIEGKLGQALSFDAGGNDGVVIAGDTYDNLSVFSVSAWTNLAGYGAARGYVAGKSSGYLDDGWTLYSYTTFSELVFEVDYTTTNLFVGVPLGSSDFNEWVHWTVTWDGTVNASGVHFYRNGVEISHGSNQSASGTRVSDASNSLILGGNTADRGVDGKLDELRIYNRVVTAAEAKALYSSGK